MSKKPAKKKPFGEATGQRRVLSTPVLEGVAHNAALFHEHNGRFYEIFKAPLSQFWPGHITGFDVVRFDILLVKPKEGESTYQAVQRQWGGEAVQLVNTLISAPERKVP